MDRESATCTALVRDFLPFHLPDPGFIFALKQHNIGASLHFMPLHLHPYYRDCWNYRPEDCPTATAAYERLVSLPPHTRMNEQDLCNMVRALRLIIQANRG